VSFNERRTKLKETYRPREEWWSRVFASPVAYYALCLVADLKFLTPNLLTLLSFLLTLSVAGIIVINFQYSLITASIVLQVAYILDCMDGQLARYRGMSTDLGAYLDKVLDYIKFPIIILAIARNVFDQDGNSTVLFLGFATIFFICFLSYLKEFVKNDFSISSWKILSNSSFIERNLRFFLFEEAQWYFIVSLCLFLNRIEISLWILFVTQGIMALIQLLRVVVILNRK